MSTGLRRSPRLPAILLPAILALILLAARPATAAATAAERSRAVEELQRLARVSSSASATVEQQQQAEQQAEAAHPAEEQPISVAGKISSKFMQSESMRVRKGGYAVVHTTALFRGESFAHQVSAGTFHTAILEVSGLEANADGKLYVQGSIQIDGSLRYTNYGDSAPSFLELAVAADGSPDGEGVFHSQWRLVAHDDFSSDVNGWVDVEGNDMRTAHCGFGDQFMVAEATARADDSSKLAPAMSKTFLGLSPHSKVELQARVHFIGEWDGSTSFALLDDEVVWLDSHVSVPMPGDDVSSSTSTPGSPNLCGENSSHSKLAVPVRAIIPHAAPSVRVAFGAVVRSGSGLKSVVLGVDDVSLYVH